MGGLAIVYKVKDAVKTFLEKGRSKISRRELELSEEFKSSCELVKKAIEDRRVAIVQGPPGTGKTTVYEEIIRMALSGKMMIGDNEVLCYEVPHNAGVKEMLDRVAFIMGMLGYTERDFYKIVRVYGSQFDFRGCEDLNKKPSKDVKIIITTEFQKVYSDEHRCYHLLLDETSRTRIHEPFIVHARELVKVVEEGEDLEGSISVIGDPMQAIVLPESYALQHHKRKKRLVLERFIVSLLEHEGISPSREILELTDLAYKYLKGKYYELLETTWRLPAPTEIPISKGFYHGRLKAKSDVSERLRSLEMEPVSSDILVHDYVKEAVEIVEEAVSTGRALIVVEPVEGGGTKDYADFRKDALFSPIRAKWAIAFGLALSSTTLRPTRVLAPYVDQAFYTKLECQRLLPRFEEKVDLDFTTVQKFLGLESFNVVAVLGKEYGWKKKKKTIYFREPELLNVQLSRHKGILVVIGNLRRLYKEAKKADMLERVEKYRPLWVTAKHLLNLVEIDPDRDLHLPRTHGFKREGEGGIYIRVQ